MTRPARRTRLALAVAIVLATSTCGSSAPTSLDRSQTQATVKAQAERAYRGLAVGAARCPRRARLARGVAFRCTVTVAGAELPVLVTERDAKGHVTITGQAAVISAQHARQLVALHATLPATVDCGPASAMVVRPGQSFTCTATFSDATSQHVQVQVLDIAGNARITAAG